MSTREEELRSLRESAALFELPQRAVIEVRGSDRERWLDGMVSNEVKGLAAGSDRSGCYATLLTVKGRIVADLHVLARPEAYWLDVEAGARELVLARLDRYLIADDVTLEDRGSTIERLGVEGPSAAAWLGAAGFTGELPGPDGASEGELAGIALVVAAYGWSGESAFQLFAPEGSSASLVEALGAVRPEGACPSASAETLEVARIEAGVPRQFAELDEEVFPAEARLDERAVSSRKGCYTGQEIVARLRSRGHVNHLLVALRFEGPPPAPDTELSYGDKRTGEVTSVCESPTAGAIGLGYVRVEHSQPGTELRAGESAARVAELGAARREPRA